MKRQREPQFKKAAVIVTVFFISLFGLLSLWAALKNLECFRVKNVVCEGGESIRLPYLKGKNIFAIDLQKESVYISGLYPVYKKIRIVRILPDALYVDFIKRKPLAYVRLNRYFCIDSDFVLFNPPQDVTDLALPVITGLDSRIFGVTSGKRCNLAELALALNIIKEAGASPGLKDYKIYRIDIANADNSSFFLSEGPEIKISAGNLKGKINILSTLLSQAGNATGSIKYVDLRFKEPVIRLKDAKQ